jgi:hypothetical protein
MSQAVILEPFIEENDMLCGGEEFVAGFKDREGTPCGITVPVSRTSIERLVLLTETFEPWLDNDGCIQCRPQEADEETYGEMLKAETVLPRMALNDLVADMIDGHRNEPNDGGDGVLEPFGLLRSRLQNAFAAVDAEIARRLAGKPLPR